MTHELTPRPEPHDITRYAEPPHVYPPYSVGYQDDGHGFDLRSIWGFVRRNWPIVLACVVLGVAAAVLYNRMANPVYESAAIIQVKTEETALDPTGFAMFPGTSDIAADVQILRSRSLAESVVDSLQLRVRITDPSNVARNAVFSQIQVARDAKPATYVLQRRGAGAFELQGLQGERIAVGRPGEPVSISGLTFTLAPQVTRHDRIEFAVRGFQWAVAQIPGRLVIDIPGPNDRGGILELSYRDSDPKLAADVPNGLADRYIEYRRREQKQAATSTVTFLRGQLDTLNVQLRESELALRQYRESAQVIDLGAEGSSGIGQLAALQAQRDQISVERTALERLRSGLGGGGTTSDPLTPSPYRRLVGYPGLLSNASLASMLASLTALETERSELLERRRLEDPEVQALTKQIRDIEATMQGHVDTYLEGLESQLTSLNSVVGRSAGELSEIPRKEFELAELLRQTTLLSETFVLLQTRLKEAEITQAIEDPNVSIIDRALIPRRPIKPQRAWNIMVGVLVGLALGVGIGYTREFLDTRIHTRDDLRNLSGLPILGLIPRIDGVAALPVRSKRLLKSGEGNGRTSESKALTPQLVADHDRNSSVSEAFRSLRTNITFSSTAERISKVFVLTSPTPQDGKTTTAANLAVTFSQQGLRVLLVDADMRRGIIHKLFRIPRTPGLSNILVENIELERAIHWTQLEHGAELDVLPTGTVPPNPAELISSARMQWLIERLQERYDAVVFDTPPLTLVTDAAILASYAHTVLLVARANKTEQGAISFAMEQLRNVGAPVRGAILNDVDFKRDSKYGGGNDYYAYSYGYGPHSED